MTSFDGFRPVTEVTADERARIPFDWAGVRKGDRFAISVSDDGAILLIPVAGIQPRR